MLDKQIQEYLSFDDEARGIIHRLAMTRSPMNLNEICWSFGDIRTVDKAKIQSVIDCGIKAGLIRSDPFSKGYILNGSILVWIFPLIPQDVFDKKVNTPYYGYHVSRNHSYLLEYLKALCHAPERLPTAEKDLLQHDRAQVENLVYIFSQPAYDAVIPRLSDTIAGMVYTHTLHETVSNLESFASLERLDEKLKHCNSVDIVRCRAEMAIIQGDFKRAQQISLLCEDEPVASFSQAICSFIEGRTSQALVWFEKGLRKQRREHKNTHLPAMSEAALFFVAAWLSKEQEKYTPVFRKIAEEPVVTPPVSSTYLHFKQTCEYRVETAEKAAKMISRVRQLIPATHEPEQLLWMAVTLGFAGKTPVYRERSYELERKMRKAIEDRYYVIAYEIAWLLTQWIRTPESSQICEELGARLGYAPLLSHIKPLEDWERQLNAYLSLEAVQSVIRRETRNGNARLAYRFHFDSLRVYPILQTCNTKGEWTPGKNVAIANFVEGKVDCMTEQDRRIAATENKYSYALGRNAIFEMIGHPCVFLEESNIHVELIAAQPILSVVKLMRDSYRIECDIPYPREGVSVIKETNTRYKVYNLNKFQYEILQAVSNCRPVPEQGYGKLLQILKHFSAHMQVQSDLDLGGITGQLRQVDADSRIRVQLLPLGDGLKAEVFVKPFGAHPPYCKPGRGGKTLIATENNERLQVTRDLLGEKANSDLLIADIRAIRNVNTLRPVSDSLLMTFNNPLDSLELLDVLKRHQDIAVVEWPEGERFRIRRRVKSGDLRLRIKSNVNWFELDGELKVEENMVLSLKSLLELVRLGRGRFVELGEGEFLALSEQLQSRLSELEGLVSESGNGVVLNRFASASVANAFDEFENLEADRAWLDFRKRLETAQLSDAAVPPLLQTELRPYQTAGFQWMIRLSEWGAGACLADDMGLGKTVQAIAVLLHRMQTGPALVVAPVSVIQNWVSEVNRFAPALQVKTLNDGGDRAATLASLEAGDLLVTSYGLLLSEEEALTAKHWATVMLDEAHVIKNYNTKTSKAAMTLQADFRAILTGTPLQNHLGEMWNLFQFINPGLLGNLSRFTETFVRPTDERTRERLKKLITPFILRRTKTAVLKELPPKTEIVWKITLSDEEMAFYETLRRKAIESLESDDSPQGAKHIKVLAEITRLRQACCHPALVSPEIGIESTKLSTFLEIASDLKENGHRALVFSQFVTHLTIVRNALDGAGFSYRYLDGSTPPIKRLTEVRSFQGGAGDFFLISLRAGGLGLNLTSADYVIHLDPWWNPAIEDQASDRAYRIGQLQPVTVYRLVAKQTIEEKIIQLHGTKRDLADSLLAGSDRSAKLSINELMELIRER
ncbi:MAG: DEAD/DEAH box helicase [Tannerella sp.]|jgi:SNF2 family DNA or RNA helicase|nr:DEAD/DEAH box helicase [Tannerella sp.]